MDLNFLDFEQPIAELEAKIKELNRLEPSDDVIAEIQRLQKRSNQKIDAIFSSLTAWQITQLARHPKRPYMNDYINRIFTDFVELFGDRMYANDYAIVGGLARFNHHPVMIIGHQKGRTTEAKIQRNFGMPKPEGYRKSQRLMRMAEKFSLPIITFIDTPGAYPGVNAEERGQSEAIATSLKLMSTLKTPIISIVIGEGGSGGALAIGVCDQLIMLQYSTYSVISPEGCASILYKSADKAPEAAQVMGLTSEQLSKSGLVDLVIQEPVGGAHRDIDATATSLKAGLTVVFDQLIKVPTDQLIANRLARLNAYSTAA